MTVQELFSRMSAKEMGEWEAYASLEPFGEDRADLRNAMSMAQRFNLVRGTAPAKSPKDFMPYLKAAKKSKTLGKQLDTAFRAWNKQFKGR